MDWKAEYSALSSTRSQKKKLKQPTPVPVKGFFVYFTETEQLHLFARVDRKRSEITSTVFWAPHHSRLLGELESWQGATRGCTEPQMSSQHWNEAICERIRQGENRNKNLADGLQGC